MLKTQRSEVKPLTAIPFLMVNLAALSVFWVGVSKIAVTVCIALYVIRMFGITAGYHRYFSHRSYKTSRFFQFILAWIGCSAAQTGPLWWAAHHRHHHRYADQDNDVHSPIKESFWFAHLGWIFCEKNWKTDFNRVKDFAKFPELHWLNRNHYIAPFSLAVAVFFFGLACEKYFPSLGTNRWQMLSWGFFLSTFCTYHATFTINSLMHLMGKKRFNTTDESKNSFILAILTLGEGWHNNHHFYQASERQGMVWWEIDISHYILKTLSFFGIVWDLNTYPKRILELRNKTAEPICPQIMEELKQLENIVDSSITQTAEASK